MLNSARNKRSKSDFFKIRRPLCIICLAIMTIMYLATGRAAPYPKWDTDLYSGKEIQVIGRIIDRQVKNNCLKLYINNVQLVSDKGKGISATDGINNKKVDENENGIENTVINQENIDIEGLVVNISDCTMEKYTKLGSLVEVYGVFAAFDIPYNEGEFDSRSYYKIRGYDGQVKKARLKGVSRDYNCFKEELRIFRNRSEEIIFRYMDEEYAATLSAMLLGDKTGLDTEVKELYQNAGISHILALSGLHIATIGLAFLKFLRKASLPTSMASAISSIIIAVYCIMTGMSTSAVRAVIMFLMGVLAMSIGRTYDLITAAAFSAICILLERPGYLYDASFQLSFMAIAGFALIYPVLYEITSVGFEKMIKNAVKNNRLKRGKKEKAKEVNQDIRKNDNSLEKIIMGITEKIRQSMCISMSITLATLPITAYSFFQISKYSIFLNLVVIPLMSVVLALGAGGIAAGIVVMLLSYKLIYIHLSLEYICREAFLAIQKILELFNWTSRITSKLKDNLIILGRPSIVQCVIYYIGIVLFVILNNKSKEKIIDSVGCEKEAKTNQIVGVKRRRVQKHKKGNIEAEALTSICIARIKWMVLSTIYITFIGVILCWHPRNKMEIRNIYVGQGDCTLICGNRIPTLMIDGGSSDVKQVGKYKMLPVIKSNRLNKIDYCFLTHMDKDHINGVLEIMENYSSGIEIKNIVVSESYINACESYIEKSLSGEGNIDSYNITGIKEGTSIEKSGSEILDAYYRLIKLQEDGRTKLLLMKSGDEIRMGRLLISCLSPEASYIYDGNDSSLVLMLMYGNNYGNNNSIDGMKNVNSQKIERADKTEFKALFTGDISSKMEDRIKTDLNEVDYLKVAHHGSRYSTSDDFVNITSPKVAVVSAGVNNSYGHPHKETMDRLRKYIKPSAILRTDDRGQVTTKIDKGSLYVRGFLD